MFRPLRTDAPQRVQVSVNGHAVDVPAGQSVWSALALSGRTTTRKAALSGDDRSADCAMVCLSNAWSRLTANRTSRPACAALQTA